MGKCRYCHKKTPPLSNCHVVCERIRLKGVAEIENLCARYMKDRFSLDTFLDYAKIVGKKYYMGKRETVTLVLGELASIGYKP
jgi:hypothetical protein